MIILYRAEEDIVACVSNSVSGVPLARDVELPSFELSICAESFSYMRRLLSDWYSSFPSYGIDSTNQLRCM